MSKRAAACPDSTRDENLEIPSKISKTTPEYFDLGNRRRVTVDIFKGKTLVNIREYYEDNGELKPSKKGITLNPQQFAKLCDLIPDIKDEIEKKSTK